MNILLLKSLTCTIRITQRRAPHVSMEAMQSTSRPAADEAFPHTHLTSCDLHCSAATAAWRIMLIMLHGVTGGPATSLGLEVCCPVTGMPRSGDGDIHYSTVVKTTAGRPLTVGR